MNLRRVAVLPLLLLSASFVVTPAAFAASQPAGPPHAPRLLGKNLLKNPGAESGKGVTTDKVVPVPSWTAGAHALTVAKYSANLAIDKHAPGPAARGKKYFFGGPTLPVATAFQNVDLSPLAAVINSGKATFVLQGWLGGVGTRTDTASVLLSFWSKQGNDLLNIVLKGPTPAQRSDATALELTRAGFKVPVGSVRARVQLTMRHSSASGPNTAVADNLSLVLSKS